MKSQFYGAFWGFIVGDFMGVPVEFSTREERTKSPVLGVREYGVHNQPKGAWSDDTSLTLCLVQCLVEGYSLQRLAELFQKYTFESYMTPFGQMFDIGDITYDAVQNMRCNMPLWECGARGEWSNGNGSLMRVLPLVFFLYHTKDVKKRQEMIADVGSITHAHKRSIFACIFYVEYCMCLLRGLDKEIALKRTAVLLNEHCKETYGKEFPYYQKIIQIHTHPEEDIRSTGYVVDTLEASLWSFLVTESYQDAVLTAINLGGDTDTIGAITGSMAGLYYGADSIPQEWISQTARRELIQDWLEKFYDLI